jgi:type I restriction enzyme S subunit
MSRIDDLIAELAPKGVAYESLGDLVRIRNGRDYKHLGGGKIPVYGSGGVMTYVDTAAYNLPSVLIPRKGSLSKLYYVDGPFWTVDTIFYTEIGSRLVAKFLFYFLATQRLEEMNKAGGVPSLTQGELNKVRVPVPPLEVQHEIVRILDHFTELEAELKAELEAELEARRRQYAFYRDQLLTFPEAGGVRRVPMGDVLSMRAGHFIAAADINAVQDAEHPYPCYGGNGLRGYVATPSHEGDFVLIGRQGAWSGNIKRARGKFYATEHAVVVTPTVEFDTSWLFHELVHLNLNQYVSHGAQPGLAVSRLNNVLMPVPEPSEQVRTAAILDKFEALVNSLSEGLPAELNARRKQYEYYREKLLTFDEVAA